MRHGWTLLIALAALAPQNPVTAGWPMGPHAVGFRHEIIRDPAREYRQAADRAPEPGGRPIALSLWYPAGHAVTPALTVLDYLTAGDESGKAAEALRDEFGARLGAGMAADDLAMLLRAPMRAASGAPPSGRWPLVLFSHAAPAGQAVMAEFLASHGFVVAGIPSRDATAGPYRLSVPNLGAIGLDLQVVIRALSQRAYIDTTRPAVIGMSNGALGAVALEAAGVRLAGIVSLDGTIGERAAAQAVPQLRGPSGPALTAPLLHLYAPDNPYLDFIELRSEPRERCELGEIAGLAHTDFLSDAVFRATVRTGDSRAQDAAAKFGWICRRTLAFLIRQMTRGAVPANVIAADAAGPGGLALRPCR